ncbi:MAG: multiheme c-type cytochrome, partial [Planctomycetota bacterium]
ARDCAKCHKKQYDEWSISSHAYAFVSPMFHKFEQTITNYSQGTVGYFCIRCHGPVAVAMGESRDTPLWELAPVAREGVTCIACHRINEVYAKTNGDRRIVPGDIYAPVYGGIGGDGVAAAIADKAKYKVKTSPAEKGAGQPIHTEGRFFQHLSQAEFCTACHQVAVHPGIKLEVVWEQYRASPACKKGVTCQHCHMGTVPGVASPYEIGPIAEVGGKHVNEHRRHANHVFYGPGYSIAHPGIFPFHKDGERWRMDEWLLFDWRAGWGTDEFEDAVADGRAQVCFPKVWKESDDRYDARDIINDNLERLKEKRELRRQVMEHGSKVAGPYFKEQPCRGRDLKFSYVVTNLNEGHNLPTASLGAQPQLWANVVLIGPDGRRLWETGYTDSNGDLADIHSVDVRNGRLPFDSQLFNLQTMFLITGATGTDREFFLPVNVSIDQVPHLRPGNLPITVTNHPPFIRMESRSIAPLGSKRVKYKVPGEVIQQPGRYRLSFRMRSRTEPMYFMRFCDSTVDMQRSMMEGILDVHPYSVEFEVK